MKIVHEEHPVGEISIVKFPSWVGGAGPGRRDGSGTASEHQKQQEQAGLGRNRAAETARVEDDPSLGPSVRADEDIPETVKDAEADKAATGHSAHNVPDKTHPGPHIG